MSVLRSIADALSIVFIVIMLFGVPLLPCYLIWWIVGPTGGWLALATMIIDVFVYIVVWFWMLVLVVAILN